MKEVTSPASYWLILLINQDVKIFTAILAHYLNAFITTLIHEDQTGFMPGQYIRDNIRKMLNLIQYCNHHNILSTLLSLDTEKAFDNLKTGYSSSVLTEMNSGTNFLCFTQALYNSFKTLIRINSFSSSSFRPVRGYKTPLQLLFAMATEPFAVSLRAIQGISESTMHDRVQNKFVHDDITNPEKSITTVQKLLDCFEQISCLHLNHAETCISNMTKPGYIPKASIQVEL